MGAIEDVRSQVGDNPDGGSLHRTRLRSRQVIFGKPLGVGVLWYASLDEAI